jgi:hypothetical protein
MHMPIGPDREQSTFRRVDTHTEGWQYAKGMILELNGTESSRLRKMLSICVWFSGVLTKSVRMPHADWALILGAFEGSAPGLITMQPVPMDRLARPEWGSGEPGPA